MHRFPIRTLHTLYRVGRKDLGFTVILFAPNVRICFKSLHSYGTVKSRFKVQNLVTKMEFHIKNFEYSLNSECVIETLLYWNVYFRLSAASIFFSELCIVNLIICLTIDKASAAIQVYSVLDTLYLLCVMMKVWMMPACCRTLEWPWMRDRSTLGIIFWCIFWSGWKWSNRWWSLKRR